MRSQSGVLVQSVGVFALTCLVRLFLLGLAGGRIGGELLFTRFPKPGVIGKLSSTIVTVFQSKVSLKGRVVA